MYETHEVVFKENIFVFFFIQMYDVDHDGRLSKEDVQEILKMMVKQSRQKKNIFFNEFSSSLQVGKVNDDETLYIAEKVISEFVEDQPTSTVSLETFEELLKTLDFDDKMSLKFLK